MSSTSAPLQNYGLIRTATSVATLSPMPIPNLPSGYMLVQVIAIALNPTDWTTLDAVGLNESLMGCDYSGIVENVGPGVSKTWKRGDHVAGFGHGGMC